MKSHEIAQIIGISEAELTRIRSMPPEQLFQDTSYMQLLETIDASSLENTLQDARDAYERVLPQFQDNLHENYGIDRAPMFSESLGKWMISVAQMPQYIDQVAKLHDRLDPNIIAEGVPLLLEILDYIPNAKNEWKRALMLIVLPMLPLEQLEQTEH